jgi:hypothetical protein
MAFLVPS